MTSTSVKEVSALFTNMTAAQVSRNNVGGAGFQNIWNNQMNKNSMENSRQDNDAGAARKKGVSGEQMQKGSSLKVKESQVAEKEPVQELSPEELQKAVELLGTAAMELMQEIADVFGISMEELQAVMEGLGMEQLDVLDAAKLSSLLLGLGGAEDLSALVTDGELYDSYRMLMGQLDNVLEECAQEAGTSREELLSLLQNGFGQDTALEEDVDLTGQLVNPTDVREMDTDASEKAAAGEEQTANADMAQSTTQEAQNQKESQSGGQERHSGGNEEKEPQMNLFLQNLRAEQFQPDVGQAQDVTGIGAWSENTQEIMNQILDYMKLQLNADTTNLEMQLHPASLGTLQIQLASKAGVVTANFIAQNEAVKAALEVQMVQLKEQFEEQGIKVESIQVTVQTHEFERNLDEQGRGRNQQPEKKNRTRRINLNGSLSAEDSEMEEITPLGRIAVGSSTVEYTA